MEVGLAGSQIYQSPFSPRVYSAETYGPACKAKW